MYQYSNLINTRFFTKRLSALNNKFHASCYEIKTSVVTIILHMSYISYNFNAIMQEVKEDKLFFINTKTWLLV